MPAGLGTLFVGLLLIVLAFVEGDSVWKNAHQILFGLFGCGSFVLGAAVCYLAILYTRGQDLLMQVFKLLLGLIFASGTVIVFSDIPADLTAAQMIAACYQNGANAWLGGGVLGTLLGGNLLLLFKQIDETTVATYRNQIRLCIEEIDAWFESQVPGQKSRYICGTVQNRFSYYGRIYEDIMWLYRYRQKKELKVYFLADYLTEYMMSQISTETMAPLLDIYVRLIREHMDESIFRETIGALIETSMNLSEAAELLYLHKNTVAARVKKIKELLGISPLTSIRDAIFMTAIYKYLNMV